MELTDEEVQLLGLGNAQSNIDKATLDKINKIIFEQGSGHLHRKQFLERLKFMPAKTIQGVLDGSLQIVDHQYFGTKSVEGVSSVEIFEEDDVKSVGFCNLEKGKLEEGRPFVLSAIRLAYHTGSAVTAATAATFTNNPFTAEIYNAEWMLRYNEGDIYNRMPIQTTFSPGLYPSNTTVPAMTEDTDASAQSAYTLYPSFGFNTGEPHGQYELRNPKLFLDAKRIEFALKFGQALSSAHHAFKVFLIGTTVRKA